MRCCAISCMTISIHALLAESDIPYQRQIDQKSNFYPRSPCGERQYLHYMLHNRVLISIHALLAESDIGQQGQTGNASDFYPRSPCGERPYGRINDISRLIFLSTLSLRRATVFTARQAAIGVFLSTLSLRRATACQGAALRGVHISIHALLAESDPNVGRYGITGLVFLSTLSLRRATYLLSVAV